MYTILFTLLSKYEANLSHYAVKTGKRKLQVNRSSETTDSTFNIWMLVRFPACNVEWWIFDVPLHYGELLEQHRHMALILLAHHALC
jgi:hypothetical protein